LIQKGVCDLTRYQFQGAWKGEWFLHDEHAQVLLRGVSNVCMSTAIAVLFFALSYLYSIGLAILALVFMLAVPSVWFYWVEARPYALWLLLTVIQSIFFIKAAQSIRKGGRDWLWLCLSHVMLSLTIAFGAVQAIVASIALWLLNERRWGRYLGLTIIPAAIGFFYYQHSPKFKYWFQNGPLRLILDNVPAEYWMLLVLCLAAVYFLSPSKDSKPSPSRSPYALFAVLMIAAAWAVLGVLKYKANLGTEGFAISSRYFLFLIPVVSMVLAFIVRDLWRRFKNDSLIRLNILIVVGGFLMLRAVKAYIAILASGTFMHVIR
jgi:hypothetical protein